MTLLAAKSPGLPPTRLRVATAVPRSDYGGGIVILTPRRNTSEFHASRMSPFGDSQASGGEAQDFSAFATM